MKKTVIITVVFAFVLSFTTPVLAGHDPMEKLKGGLMDVVKSPLQVKDHVVSEYEASSFKPFGVLGGLLKGTFYTVKQLGTGLVHIVTFPVAKP